MHVTNCRSVFIVKSDSGLEWKIVIIKCRDFINDSTVHEVRNKLSHLCKRSKQQNFLHLAVIHFSFASLGLSLQPLGGFPLSRGGDSVPRVWSEPCMFGSSRDPIGNHHLIISLSLSPPWLVLFSLDCMTKFLLNALTQSVLQQMDFSGIHLTT